MNQLDDNFENNSGLIKPYTYNFEKVSLIVPE